MNRPIVESPVGVTLVAGGPVAARDLAAALALAPVAVAADGGADRLLRAGHMPAAVIGDLDSIGAAARSAVPPDRLHEVAEQETTDFDKALRSINAPFVLTLGVLGGRMDHALAAMTVLAGRVSGPPCIALSRQDAAFAAPPRLRLDLRAGDRLSLWPMARLTGTSRGLDWPIDGLVMEPAGRIGTSNRVSRGPVELAFDGPGMLVILPRARLRAALAALVGDAQSGVSAARPPARGERRRVRTP
ncbi:MAG TPA: thiamine diphosphokinase [Paracoccaceae bacterium]|nr:thiamine diphosphokinase [Paracoccaceae bacterium]HMO72026.1 thiamine diphosphokinase [Paracoccaceae bacterium]